MSKVMSRAMLSAKSMSAVRVSFPRLRAALALAGLGVSFGAVASPDGPAPAGPCDSGLVQFGNYRMQTRLFYPEDEGVTADFSTELQRHFSDILQPLSMQVPQAANEAAIRHAYLSHQARHLHITEDNTFISGVTALGVIFPDLTQVAGAVAVKRVTIEAAEQQLTTDNIVPAEQADMLAAWIAQPETEDVFKQWQSAATVTVAFFGQVNGKEQLIGRISLAPDAMANYSDLLSQQVFGLWQKASEQACIPHSHPQAASDPDCFFTTASVHCLGLQDDCWELTTLRRFRDNYLLSNEAGRQRVAQYYAIAPAIVRHIQQQANAQSRWLRVYWGGVLPSAILARLGLHKAAMHWYSRLVRQLSS